MSLEDLLPPLPRTSMTWRIEIDVPEKGELNHTDDINDIDDSTQNAEVISPVLDSGGYPASPCKVCRGGSFFRDRDQWRCVRCQPPAESPSHWCTVPGGTVPDGDPQDLEAMLEQAVAETDIRVADLHEALDASDRDDIRHGRMTIRNLRAFTATLDSKLTRSAEPVRCISCVHFRRPGYHPHLGSCAAGLPPDGAAGLWDTDRRLCTSFSAAGPEPSRREESGAVMLSGFAK